MNGQWLRKPLEAQAHSLGPAFYGLRTSILTILTLLFMALWRIKRPEGLKEHSPQEPGRVLGLDRAPEVKTLRRKLSCLAVVGRAAQFGQALAEQRVALRGAALGFLVFSMSMGTCASTTASTGCPRRM